MGSLVRGAYLALLLCAVGCGDNLRPSATVVTNLGATTFAAGERINASCDIVDAAGEPVLDAAGNPLSSSVELVVAHQHPDSFALDDEAQTIAAKVGTATVRCSAPSLGLVDPAPVDIEIVAGPAARVFTQLASDTALAGEPVGVTCVAFDAFNNPVPVFNYTLAMSPTVGGTTVEAASVTASLVGDYEVTCVVPNAGEVEVDYLLVVPALPASLAVSLSPERQYYAITEEVAVVAQARDRFANRVDDATYAYTAAPVIPSPVLARFRFDQDGTFSLGAEVTSATQNDLPLRANVTALVNTSGPLIVCMNAANPNVAAEAYMIQQGPGTLMVPVHVEDTFDVASVTLNGATATLDAASGNYVAGVPIDFGMNFVDVVATDSLGAENSTTCFILAAAQYTNEDAVMPGALALRLDPRAVGDPSPGGLNSLNDVLFTVLSSTQLRTLVNAGITSANPIHNGGCGVLACEPRVNYNTGSITWGTPSSSLNLVAGGLQATITLPNVRLNVNACGTTCCIGGSTIAVTASSITASVNFRLQLQGGVLRAAVNGNPNVTVGAIGLDGSGFCGFIVNLIEGFLTGTVRNAVRDALAGFINSDVGPLLDSLVSSLDVSTLADSFAVPRLDGTGTVQLGFGLAFSSLDINPTRFLLGIGTRFTPSPVAHTRASLGVPRRSAAILLDPPGLTTARPVGLSFYEGVLNELLHGLWRGGFFQATLNLGGGTATIDSVLPPVAKITTLNQAQLMLGGIRATITIPGVINNPIPIQFGGRASASVSLVGNDLQFGNLVLDELFVSFDVSLTQGQRNALENLLTDVLQDVLASALNDGLPAFPIPSFTLPAAAADFGLPVGAELGITNPVLGTTAPHYVLTGGFGRRN